MQVWDAGKIGRVLYLSLQKGEDVLACLEQAIADSGIRNGVVTSGVGAMRKVCYHRVKDTADLPTNVYLTVEGPSEVTAMQGLIADGEPHLHIAGCCGDRAFVGHLEHGTEVLYITELCVAETLGAPLCRLPDEYGVCHLQSK